MRRFTPPVATFFLVFAAVAPATASAAGPEACGGIDFWSVSECHFEFDGGCESQCEPLSFSAACDGQCNLDIEGSCTASCEASCTSECHYDPAQFSCEATCTADCRAGASAHCGADSSCASYFEANCQAQCEGECSLVPPSASCEARCQSCCAGSCELQANAECELECTANLEGGCVVDCRQPEGALFCDGQYIPVQDLPTCVEYLISNFSVELEAEAHAEMTLTCATTPPGLGDTRAPLWLAGLAVGAALLRRGRRELP